jgi:hypothetical protein
MFFHLPSAIPELFPLLLIAEPLLLVVLPIFYLIPRAFSLSKADPRFRKKAKLRPPVIVKRGDGERDTQP